MGKPDPRRRKARAGGRPPKREAPPRRKRAKSKPVEELRASLAKERAARRKAEEAARLKANFLTALSHDLRTPLNIILFWAQLLQEGELDAETAARGLEHILNGVRFQGRLISEVIDGTRAVADRLEVTGQVVDVAAELRTALGSIGVRNKRLDLALTAAGEPGAFTVFGDPNRLREALGHLLEEVVRLSPPGEGIETTVQRSGPVVEIEVVVRGTRVAARKWAEGPIGEGLKVHGAQFESAAEGDASRLTLTLPVLPGRSRPERG